MRKIPKDQYFELYVFCMDFHSGQWSRGYRLMSKLGPAQMSDRFIEECRESEIYQHLVANYANAV